MNENSGVDPAWDEILARLAGGQASGPEPPPVADRAADAHGERLRAIYLPLVEQSSLVIAQLGQTLDGRIATRAGDSHFVNGPEGIQHLHRLRALVDAVVVGAGTVAADDPQLTVRRVAGRDPVRVVLDPSGRLSATAIVFQDQVARTLWVRSEQLGSSGVPAGVDVLLLPERVGGGFEPKAILQALAGYGLKRILVEGGGITISGFLAAGALDRLHVIVSPILLGSGRPSFTLEPVEHLYEALRPRCSHFSLGSDVLFDLCFSP